VVTERWSCSNCGSTNISPTSIRRGIGAWPIGLCLDCSPKIGALPDEDDPSPKMQKRRAKMLKDAATKAYRTKLTPLVPLGEYRPRTKPVEARPLGMFED
jgi:hypothetical protein